MDPRIRFRIHTKMSWIRNTVRYLMANVQDNPLVPSLAQAAGPCITPNDCALCAKKVVALLQSMESQLMRSENPLQDFKTVT
jgi:hypothetical protein